LLIASSLRCVALMASSNVRQNSIPKKTNPSTQAKT
jgi:hypothetical protein